MKINIEHHHSTKCELCGEKLGVVYKKEDVDKCIENIERRIKKQQTKTGDENGKRKI